MSKPRRYFAPEQTCFVTVVTSGRRRILDYHSGLLVRAILNARKRSDFTLIALVILPDHFHAIIGAPHQDIARVLQRIKLSFSLQLKRRSNTIAPVWQPRFWDHVIRSTDDLNRHIDYIHYNPVKHGLVAAPREWPLSSFFRYVSQGYYDRDWRSRRLDWPSGLFGE